MQGLDYQARYCEENIWRLARRRDVVPGDCDVLFIGSAWERVAMWAQRRGGPEGVCLWDYHVVLVEHARHEQPARVWDLDSLLPAPCELERWLAASFADQARVLPQFRALFRVVPRDLFLATFRSDRSHMRDEDGAWHAPPPSWPAPTPAGGSNVMALADMIAPGVGDVVDVRGLRARYSGGSRRSSPP